LSAPPLKKAVIEEKAMYTNILIPTDVELKLTDSVDTATKRSQASAVADELRQEHTRRVLGD
jgi:hypothetical protein